MQRALKSKFEAMEAEQKAIEQQAAAEQAEKKRQQELMELKQQAMMDRDGAKQSQ